MDAKEYVYGLSSIDFRLGLWSVARKSPNFSAVCSGSQDPSLLAELKEEFISVGVPPEVLKGRRDVERLSQLVASRYLAENSHLRP